MQCNSCIHPLAIDGDLGLYGREGRNGPSILEYRQLSPLRFFMVVRNHVEMKFCSMGNMLDL